MECTTCWKEIIPRRKMRSMGAFKRCRCKDKDRCNHEWQLRTRWRGSLVRISAREFAGKEVRTKREANDLYRPLRDAVRQGKLRAPEDPRLFSEVMDQFKTNHVEARGLNYDSVQYQFETLKKKLGSLPLSEVVKPKHFDAYLRGLGSVKPATRNRHRALFRSVLNYAKRQEWIEKSPFDTGEFPFEKEKNQRGARLHADWEVRLWSAMGPYLRGLFVAALDTGLRRGALLRLRLQDVDYVSKVINVPASIQKDSEPIQIPLTHRLEILLRAKRRALQGNPKAYIFGDDFGNPRAGFPTHSWHTALRKAGLAEEDIHWHDLRGEFASRLLERGASLRSIQMLLGHSKITMTERYLRPRVSAFKNTIQLLDTPRFKDKKVKVTVVERKLLTG